MENRFQITIVSHTHWDRAWYVTYQEFRARLVRLIDRLITLLENRPEFRVYCLDGQMSILEDYLEVRPQRADQIQALCCAGRITVGPWYVLADEFLVSPEALIRNLMIGHRMGEAYGGVMKIGYVPDGFGHIAQLPQILRGFGIDNAFFWRGLGAEGDQLGTEFEWRAPDGSKVTTIWMPWGYHNISNIGYPIHWGDTSQMEFSMEMAINQIRQALTALMPFAHTPAYLLMNGIDHAEAEGRLPEIISKAQNEIEGVDFHQGTFADHLQRVRTAQSHLPTFEGEFRWGRYSEILQGVYSTRIHLKQHNHRIETLLERYAEPLSALAWLTGADVPQGTQDLLWTGWRWLLKNHPHDDLYGSGIDAVHAEMLYRFSQAEQIGQVIVRDSLRQLAGQVDFTAQPGIPLLVYNPVGCERHEMAVGDIDFDYDDPSADDFRIVDNQGLPIVCQVLTDHPEFWMETLKANRKRRVRVAFPTEIPACGYRTYYVQPGLIKVEAHPVAGEDELPSSPMEQGQYPQVGKRQPRSSGSEEAGSDWHVDPNGAENKYISFKIGPDGCLDITDKITTHIYPTQHYFYDIEDAGDEYSYCPCKHSQPFSTRGGHARVALLHQGANQITFKIDYPLILPEGLTEDRQYRLDSFVAIPIISEISIYRDLPGIYIHTTLENHARDHKLSVVFPTDLNPAQASVDASFAIIQRDIDLPDSTGWIEEPSSIMHQRAFTDLSENGRGLAILNRGLPAVEVIRHPDGAHILLTLLRCVGWLSRADLTTRRVPGGPVVPTPEAQCFGSYSYDYAILPHTGDWRTVVPVAYNYLAPLWVTRADTHEGLELKEMNITGDDPSQVKPIAWRRTGSHPGMHSFISLYPQNLVLSAVRRSHNGNSLILRFYNLERFEIAARITTGFQFKSVYRTNLNEGRITELTTPGKNAEQEGCVDLIVGPAQVVTLEFCVEIPQQQ